MKLAKRSQQDVKLPDLFQLDNKEIILEQDVQKYFTDSLLETVKSLTVEGNGVGVLHCILAKEEFEYWTDAQLDDATCKVITKGFKEQDFIETMKMKIEELLHKKGHPLEVEDVEFEYNDGVFHTIAICS